MESEHDTARWVEKARAGDREAFGRLVERHRQRLQADVRRRLGGHLATRIDVADVLQETFLKAFASLDRFRSPGEDSFYFWLRGIAENLLLYWARQHQRRELLRLEGEVEGDDTSPSRRLRREERFERLEAALCRLSPDHREVILLARVRGLTLKEVAAEMGRTPEAVKPLLWRALKKLRASFGETESFRLPPKGLDEGSRSHE